MNGCHNRPPLRSSHSVQDGWVVAIHHGHPSRVAIMVETPHRMTTDCQYSLDPMGHSQKDPGCQGCRWKQQERQP